MPVSGAFYIVWQLIAQGINLNFQLGLIKQLNLVCGLLTAGAELLNPFPAQQFFENLDGVIALFDRLIALLDFSALGRQFLLKTFDNRPQFSGRKAADIGCF